jgi:AraC-like DNA-binding protein
MPLLENRVTGIGNADRGKDANVPAFRFSTHAFSERDRYAIWREFVSRQIVRLDAAPLTENPRMDAVGMGLPGLGVVGCNLSPVHCARTPETMLDGNDNVRLVILKRSASSASAAHLGRELTVEPGSAVVLSNCDLNSITYTASRSRVLAVNLPRKVLRPLLRDFDTVLAHTIPKQVGALRLLASYIEALLGEPAPPTHELGQLAVAHIYDLAALTMGATRDAAEIAKGRGLRVARLRAIKADIAEELASQNLSVEAVAIRQGVSPRYVQMLFEQEGTTFSQYVIGQRLARAHRILTDPRFADQSITSVAFDAGFGDLSYFNRAFRRCYGGTPSEIRAEAGRRIGTSTFGS